jgi:hypothetical protein
MWLEWSAYHDTARYRRPLDLPGHRAGELLDFPGTGQYLGDTPSHPPHCWRTHGRRKAKGVPLASVARSVEKAVKLAATRHDVKLAGATLLNGWEIMGKKYPSAVGSGIAH